MELKRKVLSFVAALFFVFGSPLQAEIVSLISTGSVWKYLDDGSDQGSGWRGTNYNDGDWKSGPAQLGYGEGDEATVVGYGPDTANKFITTYFRRTFAITNNAIFTNLLFRIQRDDGAAVYLNGTRVFVSNMPDVFDYATGAPNATTSTDESKFFPYNVSPDSLIQGTNVVAVEVHQNVPASADLSFDLELVAQSSLGSPPSVTITSPAAEQTMYSTNILVNVSAFGGSGTIVNVAIFANNQKVTEFSDRPYSFVWTNAPAGTDVLTARATDSGGIIGTSAPVRIFVLGPDAPWPMIFSTGSVWKYLDNGSDQGTAWREINFDDSAWRSGPAQLGYGEGDEATIVSYGPSASSKYVTTYFRRAFTLTNARGFTNAYLRILRDDGVVVYLNGVEVFRSNMSYDAPLDFQTHALIAVGGAEESTFFYHRVDPKLFVNGTNVIAVELHQSDLTSSDLSFDFELTGNVSGPGTAFNISPGQRATIRCVDHPDIAYDLYLPSTYSATGNPRPLLWTFHPNGNGMVSDFQSVANSLQMIVVGIIESRNFIEWYSTMDVRFAVARDLRRRVNYDPTAVFASGWSGGGVESFEHSKILRPHLAGVFSMCGWLENRYGDFDRYLTNLLVSRANGDADTGANYYLVPDGDYLRSYGVVIRDTIFPGVHQISPDAVKLDCLSWLLSQRTAAGPNDRTNAMNHATAWRAAIQAGDRATVLQACVNSILSNPRTYESHYAQIVLDELMSDFAHFRAVNVTNLASGPIAGDLFYFMALGAAQSWEQDYFYSCLKAASMLTDQGSYRGPDLRALMIKYGFPEPQFRYSYAASSTELTFTYTKDAAWADYTWIETSDLSSGAWMPSSVTEHDNGDGTFSVVAPTSGAEQRFYRLQAQVR
jgi:hypothetical protein